MSSKRGHYKDRILEGIAKAIKEVQSFGCGDDSEVVTVTNDDRSLQKLVEKMDHAFLHGLKNVTCGYWGVAKLFAHRGIIHEITELDRLSTDLGRSRAWLYKSLNDSSLESYLRCFQENPNTMRKYYVENSLLRDKQRQLVFQTLVSGLEFVTFDLELNIAYFDLVSYIPRSASVSEPEEDMVSPDNENGLSTPSTPATNGDTPVTNPDTDCSSSMASLDAFSPVDDSPSIKIPQLVVPGGKMEKRHSLPQHYSEIDRSTAENPRDENGALRDKSVAFRRSFSTGWITDGSKPTTRPASLGVPSHGDGLPGPDPSPRGSLKSVDEDFGGGDLEVIRIKPKKTKKGPRRKRTDRSSLDGDRPGRNPPVQRISSHDDMELPRPDADILLEVHSSSSSFASLQSFSDRGSVLDSSTGGKPDADCSPSTGVGAGEDSFARDVTEDTSDLQKLIRDIKVETAAIRGEPMEASSPRSLVLLPPQADVHPMDLPDPSPTVARSLADGLAEIFLSDDQSDPPHRKKSGPWASLDFDETVSVTFDPPPVSRKAYDPAANDSRRPPDDLTSRSLSSEATGSFASLFTRSTPDGLPSEVDLPPSSAGSSSCENDGHGAARAGVTDGEDGADSSGGPVTDEASPTSNAEAAQPVNDTHDAEIKVDNNFKLYLMLEIFNSEDEQFYKFLRMSTGHMEGDLQPAFILFTDQALYILRRGERQVRYSSQHRLLYSSLDYISVGLNYQTVQIVCRNRRKQFWLTTGDEMLTRVFLAALRHVTTGGLGGATAPISILTDATAQLITLRKWAAQACKTETSDIRLMLYTLVHWEDLTDLSATPDLQLYDPQVTKQGDLFYKVGGGFLLGSHWRRAWFVLRNEMLCRFAQQQDRQPELSVQLRVPHFGGCRRIRNGERAHSFELILMDGATLELSAGSEELVSDWLQTICQVVAQAQVATTSPKHAPSLCQPCCAVTTTHRLLLCHEDSQTNFYRLLGLVDISDITRLTSEPDNGTYVIVEFRSEPAQNPWVFYFNSVGEKSKFEAALRTVWREELQVDLSVVPVTDSRIRKRCSECSALIQSSWQRSDSLMRGRVRGQVW